MRACETQRPRVLRLARCYAKQISSSYKFGTGELNGASRNAEIKECTGDEWRCEWERVVKEWGRREREERRERTQTERTKLLAMVIEVEQRAKRSNGIVDLGFSQIEPPGYWLPQDLSRERRAIEVGKELRAPFFTQSFWFNWAVGRSTNAFDALFMILT